MRIFIVSPLETENYESNVSSRNISLFNSPNREIEVITTVFNHRYKRFSDINKVMNYINKHRNINIKIFKSIAYTNNISIRRLLFNLQFALKTFIYLLKYVKKRDLIVLNSIPPEILFLSVTAGKIKGARLFLDVRDIWPDALNVKTTYKTLFNTYCNVLYSLSFLYKFDYVSFVAPTFSIWIIKYKINYFNKVFIPLGFDEKRWGSIKYYSDKINSDSNRKHINLIYIGYLSEQFDLTHVINCITNEKFEKKINLTIIGNGPKEKYYRRISNNNIIFKGPLSHTDLVLFMQNNTFDFGLIPLADGAAAYLPNKFFDYIASLTPIISLGSIDCSNIIYEHDIGISSKNNPECIKDVFRKIDNHSMQKYKDNICRIREKYSMNELYKNNIISYES
ncbi:MAG: hypothetical protein LAT68_16740 [Cyclobacteriaceae bacterium]|nr:hypothetical protein [Cyclobacteriaceae bacterium]